MVGRPVGRARLYDRRSRLAMCLLCCALGRTIRVMNQCLFCACEADVAPFGDLMRFFGGTLACLPIAKRMECGAVVLPHALRGLLRHCLFGASQRAPFTVMHLHDRL